MMFNELPEEWERLCPFKIDRDAVGEDTPIYIEVCIQNVPNRKYRDAYIEGHWREWSRSDIRKAFRFGNGTFADFRQYAKDNQKLGVRFYEI